MFKKINWKNERGSVAIFAMVALLLLTTFGFIVVSSTANDMKNTMQALDSTQGEYIANGALLQVLDTYKGIPIKTQILANLYTDKNNNVYSAVVTADVTGSTFNVEALKNSKKIYSITATVSFFQETTTLKYGYSINSVVQNPISI